MTRSSLLVIVLVLMTFAIVQHAGAQTIIAAAAVPPAPGGAASADFALDDATIILALATIILAIATIGMWVSARKQGEDFAKSLEISGRMADAAKAQLEQAKEQLHIAAGQLDSANAERTKNLGDQLFEFDKILIAFPELQLELEALRTSGSSFLSGKHDATFVKVKSFIYMHLNFFDEIVSTYQGQPNTAVEYQDWCVYIVEKLRHPAYKEIMTTEGEIFGDRLRQFVKHNHSEIYKNDGTPWRW